MGRQRILVVEDESVVAIDIQRRLKDMGFEVAGTAATGEAAVEQALKRRPDLVLMDIMLGEGLDGIEAARMIAERLNVPIVYLTAYADEATFARAKVTGPFGYVLKPFEDRELKLTIEMALYKHGLDRKLNENRRWLATTLKSIGDAVATTDARGRIEYLNPAAEELLGMTTGQATGRDLFTTFEFLDEETGKPVAHPARIALEGGRVEPSDRDYILRTRTGEELPVSCSVAPLIDDNGTASGVVVVLHSTAHKKHAEKALRESVERLRQTLGETVTALTIMSEKRDPYTAGHQQRVTELACAMAQVLGLPEDGIEGLRVAGVLHDIGKIYVPAEILSKPTTLTDMEMGIMKTHPGVAFEIIQRVSFPWPVAQIVRQHHERLDGSGYPDGLTGGQMLPEARILAVADVVEAMSSHRPYRAALGLEVALREIESQRGRLYDADAVDACLKLFREQGFRFEERL